MGFVISRLKVDRESLRPGDRLVCQEHGLEPATLWKMFRFRPPNLRVCQKPFSGPVMHIHYSYSRQGPYIVKDLQRLIDFFEDLGVDSLTNLESAAIPGGKARDFRP